MKNKHVTWWFAAGLAAAWAIGLASPSLAAPFHAERLPLPGAVGELAQPSTPTGRALAKAAYLLQRREYQKATTHLKAMLAENDKIAGAWYLTALTHLAQDHWQLAGASADKFVALEPSAPSGYWLQASALRGRGQLESAKLAMDKAVAVASQNPLAYLRRGQFLVEAFGKDKAKLEAAVKDLEQAYDLGGPEVTTQGYLGMAHRALGHPEQALQHFRAVLKRSRYDLDAVRHAVEILDTIGRFDAATQLVDTTAKAERMLPPGRVGEFHLLAAKHWQAAGKKPDVVEASLKRAVEAGPELAAPRLIYAQWLDKMDRSRDAVPLLRAGLKQHPDHSDMAAQLAWALARNGTDLDEAMQWLNVARKAQPDDPYLADTHAWIEFKKGDFPAAVQAIKPALVLADRVPDVAYHAGAILMEARRYREAARFLKLALRPLPSRDPNQPPAPRPFAGQLEAKRLLAKAKSLGGG